MICVWRKITKDGGTGMLGMLQFVTKEVREGLCKKVM